MTAEFNGRDGGVSAGFGSSRQAGEPSREPARRRARRRSGAAKGLAIAGEQGARGFLEAGEIARRSPAGSDRPPPWPRLDRGRSARPRGALASTRRRNATEAPPGLGGEPIPMARQQRHLARDDAEFWPSAAARRRRVVLARRRDARATSASEPRRSRSTTAPVASSKVSTGPAAPGGERRFHRQRDLPQRPRRDQTNAVEGGAGS